MMNKWEVVLINEQTERQNPVFRKVVDLPCTLSEGREDRYFVGGSLSKHPSYWNTAAP